MPIAIVGGFIGDIFTLNRIDQVFDNLILIVHMLIVGLMLVFLFARDTKYDKVFASSKYDDIYGTIALFSFGGLFSGFVIFYTRSGSLLSAWPFVLLMLFLMLGTEFYKTFYKKITFQLVLYFVALFAHLIFFVPLLVKDLGAFWFLVSGVLSLVIIKFYFDLLSKINYEKFKLIRKKLIGYIFIVFASFNFLYFTNIIPPVPLSLKFKAVYHSVEVTKDGYITSYEEPSLISFRKRSHIYHWDGVSPVYVFASVFSPIGFETEIRHVWKYFDTENGKWVDISTIPISIKGGRQDGYRGFSFKTSIREGKWRVVVETVRGQDLGFINFTIKKGPLNKALIFEEL